MPDKAHIIFVLDQSGSMSSLRQSTIDGVNLFLAEQREAPGEAVFSLTLFSTFETTRYVGVPLDGVPLLGTALNPYSPGGGTALLDAVAHTVKAAEQWNAASGFSGRNLVTVFTDGQENSSKEWHLRQPLQDGDDRDLGGLIKWKQEVDGWEFVFLGAGGSQWLERTFAHVVDLRSQVGGYGHDAVSNFAAFSSVSGQTLNARTKGARYSSAVPLSSQQDQQAQDAADALNKRKAGITTPGK